MQFLNDGKTSPCSKIIFSERIILSLFVGGKHMPIKDPANWHARICNMQKHINSTIQEFNL